MMKSINTKIEFTISYINIYIMNGLTNSLIFKITDYIGCKDYIRLYRTDTNLRGILKDNLDLKLPVFVTSVYDEIRFHLDDEDGAAIYFDISKNIETSMAKLNMEKIKEIINIDSNDTSNKEDLITDIEDHIKDIKTHKRTMLRFEGKNDYADWDRVIEIRVIPERYQILWRFINFSLSNYVFEKMNKINKLDIQEMIKLKHLVDNPDIFGSHMKNIREYMDK